MQYFWIFNTNFFNTIFFEFFNILFCVFLTIIVLTKSLFLENVTFLDFFRVKNF